MKKLIVSNIAWEKNEEIEVFRILKDFSINEIEVAITKYFDSWNIDKKEIINLNNYFKKNNISVYSLQSIMYNLQFNLFDSNELFVKHIYKIIEFAKILNIKKIIFGSPKNRFINNQNNYNIDIFFETMKKINSECIKEDIYFCIEPNAKIYNCNFITNSNELFLMLQKINESNIKMHLDTACMHLEEDNPQNIIKYKDMLEHFHISEPYLNNFNTPIINHTVFSNYLDKINYNKYISIEMKSNNKNNILPLKEAIIFAKNTYL